MYKRTNISSLSVFIAARLRHFSYFKLFMYVTVTSRFADFEFDYEANSEMLHTVTNRDLSRPRRHRQMKGCQEKV